MLFETMGTGAELPAPPTPSLGALYSWLEVEQGFAQRSIRTDYAFASVEEAARIAGFFFGEGFSAQIQAQQWRTLSEWTGVWYRQKEF